MVKNKISILSILLIFSCKNQIKCDYVFTKSINGEELFFESGKIIVNDNDFEYIVSSKKEEKYTVSRKNKTLILNDSSTLLDCFFVDQFSESEFYLFQSNNPTKSKFIISQRFGLMAREGQTTLEIILLNNVCNTQFNSNTKAIFTSKLINSKE